MKKKPVAAPENSFHPKTRAEWRRWLAKNHTRTEGLWFVAFKSVTGKPRLDYEDVIEEALCFGWIDSTARTLNEERSMLWMAPRRNRSGWSKPNKERIERLLAAGTMAAPGLAKIEAAQKDGSWTTLDAVEALTVPPDLKKALAGAQGARENFDAFPRSVKRDILGWIAMAKKPETRARRVEETARLAALNERAHQPKRA